VSYYANTVPILDNVPDPEVFGPLGSRLVIICTDPDPAHINKPKKFRKILISTGLGLLNDLLSLRTDVNAPTERSKQEDFFFLMYVIQHCFICRLSDSSVSEDAGIEPRTISTLALTARRSNHLAVGMTYPVLSGRQQEVRNFSESTND
jgi:hypothetical protein